MNADIETHIKQNCVWSKLPVTIKQLLGNSEKEYDKVILTYSIKNQLRYRGNIVRLIKKDEKSYYEELLSYSKEHLMLFPYHLSDFIVTQMRMTPFQYYISVMQDLMEQEKSYDSLPNFTAADCLRLLGIGRNQYIELMNQCRSSRNFFGVRRKSVKEYLPIKPISDIRIEPWWKAQLGYVTEDDVKTVSETEKRLIDMVIDNGPQRAGCVDIKDILALYLKGLLYLEVPVEDDDYVVIPPLEGFVMNRILGDYLETLLYKIFVSLDEHTTIGELANILQIDLSLVKNAISIYCRLGFAHKKGVDTDPGQYHPSWSHVLKSKPQQSHKEEMEKFMFNISFEEDNKETTIMDISTPDQGVSEESFSSILSTPSHNKRIGFLFDSTLTAFLMMGNLSQGLKSHAVTMFEVGKLSDESLDSFLFELQKVGDVGEGEARRYFDHALTLRNTILFLRNNSQISVSREITGDAAGDNSLLGLDLIRCESLQNLDQETCSRLLNKNYMFLISMAPLTNEIRPITSCKPPHLGPAIPEVNSVWFKLFIYQLIGNGPSSLLLIKGTRLRMLPKMFAKKDKLLVTTWGHDPGTVPVSNALTTLNDALCHSAILVQDQGVGGELAYIPFPFSKEDHASGSGPLLKHPAVQTLMQELDLQHNCGFITMIGAPRATSEDAPTHCPLVNAEQEVLVSNSATDGSGRTIAKRELPAENWNVLDCSFGIPLFDSKQNGEVCKRIVECSLFSQESLKSLTYSSRKLCLKLLDFIQAFQEIPSVDNYWCNKRETEIPLPTKNLIFKDGKLSVWDGK